jgi:hypothetical protein
MIPDEDNEPLETIFHYPSPGCRRPDGAIEVSVSGYGSSSRWSGCIVVETDDPDFELWLWIIERHERFQGITCEGLEQAREEFRLSAPNPREGPG